MSEMKWQHGSTWYRVVGDLKSAKTPVMILHGGPGAGHNYCEPIADVLAQTGRAGVLYDQIGCGNSTHLPDKPKEFWTPELFMEELVLLTEHLGILNEEYLVFFLITEGTKIFVFALFFCNLFDCEGIYFIILAAIGKHMVHGFQVLLDTVVLCAF